MKITKDKTAITIALFLTLTMFASLILIPVANAHDPPWEIPTYAYVYAAPNPVGVGQTTLIYMWLDRTLDGAAADNDIRFHNYKLTITKPDGTTETKTWDVCQDSTSSQGLSYTPDQAGTYTLEFTYPGQTFTWTEPIQGFFGPPAPSEYINDTYLASSASMTLTVQEEPISDYPSSYPLPTEYWTRPIYGENPYWWSISSNWLGTSAPGYSDTFPGDAVGSQTAHIMWTKPLQAGGVVGGDNFEVQGDTYMEGSAYVTRYSNPIILNGKLYYTEPLSVAGGSGGPTKCVDLRTGEEIWSRTDVPALSFGYIYSMHNMNYHGVWPPILISTGGGMMMMGGPTTWQGYDADIGDWVFNVTNVPSGTTVLGPSGEHLTYVIANAGTPTNPQYYLGQWNSSKVGYGIASGMGLSTGAISGTVDGSAASNYDWNISIPVLNTMTSTPTILAAFYNNMLLCMNGSYPSTGGMMGSAASSAPYTYFAVNLDKSKSAVGSVLWMKTYNAPAGNITVSFSGADPTVGVFVENNKETIKYVGYSMTTGEKLWGPSGDQIALAYYSHGYFGMGAKYAYGKLYSVGFAGIFYCYDLTNGDLLWTYGNGGEGNSTNSGFQVPGYYPTVIYAIGDGIVYTVTSEHTFTTPIYKGALARAINATTGQEIWTLSTATHGGPNSGAIADGYATWFNGYDNQIYVVGKGPSATTVTAAPEVSVHGNSVLVKGMVTDISAGTTQNEQAARFPNGVPAVSDENMTAWMEYVYQQKPHPADVTGVEVVLSVLDPNNNFYEVGRATSDADGFFSCVFTPEVPGKYTIIATFEGSEGYWPSHAETAINVEEAPVVTPEPTPVPQAPVETYFAVSTIAIIAAIVIVGFLLFRKRP
jgi:hypothetical protein